RYSLAERIAGAVCDENGAPVFTVADITGEADPGRGPLDAGLAMALLKAINEVWSGKPN
ncbi:TPA: phage tail assembly chaperone family protein, TAC, partial [Escherichia coli]|nr:phage tail assembly chaperone family protein, TAC [Escherichia coli]